MVDIPSPQQHELIRKEYSGPARVFGGAGSGKSIVGLYRAARLAKTNELSRVLLTAHTPNVVSKLRRDLDLLLKEQKEIRSRITVNTLDETAHLLWRKHVKYEPAIATELYLKREVCPEVNREYTLDQLNLIVAQWLGVIDGYRITSLEEYLKVKAPESANVSKLERQTGLGSRYDWKTDPGEETAHHVTHDAERTD